MSETSGTPTESAPTTDRWKITEDGSGIVWDVASDTHLPHEDHIEMSGKHVSVIVRYRADKERRLHLTREVTWPTLRTKEGDVRGYLRRVYGPESDVSFVIDEQPIGPGKVDKIYFNGELYFDIDIYDGSRGPHSNLDLYYTIFPAAELPAVCESWFVIGSDEWKGKSSDGVGPWTWGTGVDSNHQRGVIHHYPSYMTIQSEDSEESVTCVYGEVVILQQIDKHPDGLNERSDYLDEYADFFRSTSAELKASFLTRESEIGSIYRPHFEHYNARRDRAKTLLHEGLLLETPDDAVNLAFNFAKLRAAESLFETKMGLVHSPGGGRYYGGIWNNDQCEYSGPFFAYLGDADAQRAALTAYRNFAPYMTPDYKPIPTSLEMEGTIEIHAGGDRGDAAMYASGAARFTLANGDPAIAEELYPHIAWCLEYCRRKTNAASGVVESDCDELENRFPAGDANLSTSCLYYDALRRTADLARDLGRPDDATEYARRADTLARAIETHFGGAVEGFATYRYYAGNTTLRAWICLPLAFGVPCPDARTRGTLDALFSPRMWGPDGLATEAGKPDFWDRSTLYALRGAFFAGDTERAYEHLVAYTRRRLLGEHVPYPVEAYPEGGQAHLSAESALYCRVLVEGVFGLVPTGLRSFTVTPRLPAAWPRMSITLPAFGHTVSISVERTETGDLRTRISTADCSYDRTTPPDMTHAVILPA